MASYDAHKAAEARELWGLVLLDYAYHDVTGERLHPSPPLHIYRAAPGKTLCGRYVGKSAYGWFSGGGSIDDPTFPFGPICSVCRVNHARGGTA